MSDNREGQVNQNALNELINLLQNHTNDTHEALCLLAVAAHSLMLASGARQFKTTVISGEGIQFTRLFNEPQSQPTPPSEPPTGTLLH